jgi:hypothetical protein
MPAVDENAATREAAMMWQVARKESAVETAVTVPCYSTEKRISPDPDLIDQVALGKDRNRRLKR